MKTAELKNYALQARLAARNIVLPLSAVNTLRRAAMALHRWYEMECGNGSGHLQRDDETGVPYWYNANARYLAPNDPRAWRRVPDRERGAVQRVDAICKLHGLRYYLQTDPRGAPLYLAHEVMTAENYSSIGIACVV